MALLTCLPLCLHQPVDQWTSTRDLLLPRNEQQLRLKVCTSHYIDLKQMSGTFECGSGQRRYFLIFSCQPQRLKWRKSKRTTLCPSMLERFQKCNLCPNRRALPENDIMIQVNSTLMVFRWVRVLKSWVFIYLVFFEYSYAIV